MAEEEKQIQVCSRSLRLAREHAASKNYIRAFAHYLVHKNMLWQFSEQNRISIETANISEICSTFENVKRYLEPKLNDSSDSDILTQWKSTNEQFLDLLAKALDHQSNINSKSNRQVAKEENLESVLVQHTTDFGISLFRIGRYYDACEIFNNLLCRPLMFEKPQVCFPLTVYYMVYFVAGHTHFWIVHSF